MQLSPGVRIRSFELLAPLGAGGMGAVYRARDSKLGRDVAIKFLQDALISDREYLHRFEREARAASALNHPNIVTIYEIGEQDGSPFIAMELIDGASLRDLLKKGPLPIRKLLDVAAQVADGLAAAHDRGIVHRDLKPDNVMVTGDGRVKILDFGLARISRDAGSGDSTSELSSVRTPEGRIVGTASYVSPEQASGARHVDYHSDQFSFGSLLYELATGRRAFVRASTVETLAAIVRDEPEPAQQVNPKLPPPFVWIIDRCLAKDPQDRYASTGDLARELRTLRDRLPETSPGFRRRPLTPRKRLTVAAVSAGVIVTAAGIVFHQRAEAAPMQQYLAVLPFKDLSGRPDGQLFSQGFGEAVSARLGKYAGIQVIPPASSASLVAKHATLKRIAEELGATLLLDASIQRSGDDLRISCHILDPARGAERAGEIVSGPVHDLWAVQDQIADTVARDLGIAQQHAPTKDAGLDTTEEQELYVRALGYLDHPDDLKEIDAAIESLRDLVETAPDSSFVHAALARAYRAKYMSTNEKEWADKAIRACERARARDPNSIDVLLTLGQVQQLTGDSATAITTFRRAISLQPNSPEIFVQLGGSYMSRQQFVSAEQAFRRAVDLRPTWWTAHNELGHCYLRERQLDRAEREFRSVIQLNPQASWGYLNLGVLYINQGRLGDAAAVLKTAALLGAPAAYSNLGYCYYFLGEYNQAAASYQKAIDISPTIAVRWSSFGDACAWSTSCRNQVIPAYVKAIELFRRDLTVNPNNARAHGGLAVCLAKTGKTDEAAHEIAIALDLDPTNPDRMVQAARVAYAHGRKQEALKWLQRAIAAGCPSYAVDRDPEFAPLRSATADGRRPAKDIGTG